MKVIETGSDEVPYIPLMIWSIILLSLFIVLIWIEVPDLAILIGFLIVLQTIWMVLLASTGISVCKKVLVLVAI